MYMTVCMCMRVFCVYLFVGKKEVSGKLVEVVICFMSKIETEIYH